MQQSIDEGTSNLQPHLTSLWNIFLYSETCAFLCMFILCIYAGVLI